MAGNGGNIIYSERTKRERERDREMGDLYALDFDGVLCDSCGESSLSAVKVSLFSHFFLYLYVYVYCKVEDEFKAKQCKWF